MVGEWGRNFLCESLQCAGITPAVSELNGQDPVTYIVSTNVNRRHMTKGQRAMAVARVCLETKQPMRHAAKHASVTAGRIAQASTVLQWAPELADAVLSGAHPLDKAYDIASDRKTKAEVPVRRLQALRAVDPDLADKVQEEQLTLDKGQSGFCALKSQNAHQWGGFLKADE